MGTHFPGRIQIGGKLPRSLLAEFVTLVNDVGAGFDWASPDPVTAQMIIDEIEDEDGQLSLMDGEASFGHFESLENWLDAHKMSYLVTSDSYCEYEATINGRVNGEDFRVKANQSGDATVGMEVVTSALALLKDGDVFAAIQALSVAAKETPTLPLFEIVDDEPAQVKPKVSKPKRKRKS